LKKRLRVAVPALVILLLAMVDLVWVFYRPVDKSTILFLYVLFPLVFVVQGFWQKSWKGMWVGLALSSVALWVEPVILYWPEPIVGVSSFSGFLLFYVLLAF